MVTVLHEIENKSAFLLETKRILVPTGTLAVIEFHNRQTPMGPPVSHRLGADDVASMAEEGGWTEMKRFDLGGNFYCLLLGKNVK